MSSKNINEEEYKLTGSLGKAVYWSIAAEVIFAALVILFFIFKNDFWWMLLIGFGIYTAIFIYIITAVKRNVLNDMLKFSSKYSQVQNKLLKEMNIPYCILDQKGKVLWMNRAMSETTDVGMDFSKNIAIVLKEITPNVFPGPNETAEVKLQHKDRFYKAEIENVSKMGNSFVTLYLYDITEVTRVEKKLEDNSFAVAVIDIDNYEDVVESIDDLSQSFFSGIIEKKIYDYFAAGGSFVRRLEKDRFIAVFRNIDLIGFMKDKFEVLENVKSVDLKNEMPLTLSIGVGTGFENYEKCYETAKDALEIALGRGGDQAVVKSDDKQFYFGGKSQLGETNTRVKVRVKAHALRKLLESKERVIIMGHKLPDIDAFGAAVGLYRFSRELGKETYIIINDLSAGIRPFYERLVGKEDYTEDTFITSEKAMELTDPSTVVIVVDVNKPDMTDCPEILEKAGTKIVFDHHRTGENPIKGVVLSYVDTFASSSAEMITELLQFVSMDINLKGIEADALYAGIVIDTDNFNTKAGPRTFEAAAYLRRNGADVTRVRKLLRADMGEYKAVAQAVHDARIYRGEYALSAYECDDTESPTVGCAKAANFLLDVAGIKAAFVVTEHKEKIYISARSIDEVNVQLIMERLGGGGHLGTAGAQLEGYTTETAIEKIKETIDDMIREGEI